MKLLWLRAVKIYLKTFFEMEVVVIDEAHGSSEAYLSHSIVTAKCMTSSAVALRQFPERCIVSGILIISIFKNAITTPLQKKELHPGTQIGVISSIVLRTQLLSHGISARQKLY